MSALDLHEVPYQSLLARGGFFSHCFDIHRLLIIADFSVYNLARIKWRAAFNMPLILRA